MKSGLTLAAILLAASWNVWANCLDDAAAAEHVDIRLVRAIAHHESRMNPRAVHRNSDGSEDIGLMQINDRWLRTLRPLGYTRDALLNECVSARIGAWILRGNIERLGFTWNAIGAYNAKSPDLRLAYERKIYRELLSNPTDAAITTAARQEGPDFSYWPRNSITHFETAND